MTGLSNRTLFTVDNLPILRRYLCLRKGPRPQRVQSRHVHPSCRQRGERTRTRHQHDHDRDRLAELRARIRHRGRGRLEAALEDCASIHPPQVAQDTALQDPMGRQPMGHERERINVDEIRDM